MSVCQRKSGAWICKYKDAATGQWKQRQFKTKEAAEEFDSAAKMAMEKDQPLSLRDAVGAYLQNHELSEKRVKIYLYLVNGNDRKSGVHRDGPAEHLADRFVESLNRQDLESVRSRMRADGYKVTTINEYVSRLKAVLNWCASEDLVASNPWAKYRSLPGGRVEHMTGTLEDLQAVYVHLPAWLQWAVQTALALCLRPGLKELFSLEWSAFDWRQKIARVYMPKVRSTKVVFLPDWYVSIAWPRYQEDTAAGRVLVCPDARGRQIVTNSGYKERWRAACVKAGVKLPFYAVRHIAASEMLAAGADLAAVAAQLGHRDLTTTGQFYAHALTRSQAHATAVLPDITNFGVKNQ